MPEEPSSSVNAHVKLRHRHRRTALRNTALKTFRTLTTGGRGKTVKLPNCSMSAYTARNKYLLYMAVQPRALTAE